MRNASKLFGVLMLFVLVLTGCRGAGIVGTDEQTGMDASAVQSAANTVPFHAKIHATINNVPPPPPPIVNSRLGGVGKAAPFGPFEVSGTSQVDVTVLPWGLTVDMVFTFRNGDELYVTAIGNWSVVTPGNAVLSGDISFQGGTGRFANASGTGTFSGNGTQTGPKEGIAQLTIDGDISGFGGAGH